MQKNQGPESRDEKWICKRLNQDVGNYDQPTDQ